MNLTLIQDSAPDQEPVSLSEAKAYLRQDSDADDDTIQALITAARLEAENENGRELSQKQWTLALDWFPYRGRAWGGVFRVGGLGRFLGHNAAGEISLLDPLISVDSLTWTDNTNTLNTLVPGTDYTADTFKHPGIVCPTYGNQWPCGPLAPSSAVRITFTAGFTPANVPANIKQGIMMLVSQWYEARIPFEAVRFVAEIPFSVTSLFRNNALWKF